MIFDPPEAPATILTFPFLSVIILGDIDDSGRFPGRMKLAGEGGYPKKLFLPGVEKSSISLFMMIPVDSETNIEPKLKMKSVHLKDVSNIGAVSSYLFPFFFREN